VCGFYLNAFWLPYLYSNRLSHHARVDDGKESRAWDDDDLADAAYEKTN